MTRPRCPYEVKADTQRAALGPEYAARFPEDRPYECGYTHCEACSTHALFIGVKKDDYRQAAGCRCSAPFVGWNGRREDVLPFGTVASSLEPAASLPAAADAKCRWCKASFTAARRDQQFCSKRCRQSAFRVRKGRGQPSPVDEERVAGCPATAPAGALFVYADPPYPGLAKKYYGREPTYGGEVDHPALIASLEARRQSGEVAGYALSTSKDGLRQYLGLFPPEADFAAWVKPGGVRPAAYGVHNKTEYVIFVPGRHLRPAVRDFIVAHPARGEGTLIGRKPRRFCTWLYDLLGMVPGDRFEDVFPGTGIVARAWSELSATGTVAPAGGMSERRLFSNPAVLEVGADEAVADDVGGDA
jgi:hypothetical protein